ncbi:vWA domain-containing protein [Saccharothrix variisporea]|uniref:VWA domain containing CoxE-like protein n=1 Tax=Saccharothrix variisporea TaxID=543527 RepID=A0A495X7X5_9PSEU|nr:vWA domain-containing protein [Saccharothrix variisporea]RKT69486.1 hypothetical protein DFJ66_2716 [Saccharothrix variisporea]
MSTHITADPTATGTAVFPSRPEWLTLSAALSDEVPLIADREGIVVTIAPGAGAGAPACFYPALDLIELDGDRIKIDPATAKPSDPSDRARYAGAWGAFTHECGHAKHSTWKTPDGTPPHVAEAAWLLEEARMEAAHVRRRPDDRHWLRASTKEIVAADLFADPSTPPTMTKPDAARSAALLLGRVDAAILTHKETAPLAAVAEQILGADTLRKLRVLWRKALRTADDDADTMIELGRKWCDIVGNDPDPAPDPTGDPSALSDAVNAVLGNVARAVAKHRPPRDPAARAARQRARESAAAAAAHEAREKVFNTDGPRDGDTETAGTRQPTAQERAAARALGRALTTAGIRDRVTVKSTSPVPPGRLRMRGALAADAQRAAGAIPTAQPFTRTTRTPVPTPPLRVGIACDVSGSTRAVTESVASTAWIIANAARHTTTPTQTSTVIFGNHVRPITRPGTIPTEVTLFHARDDWEDIPTALDALDGALGLSRPDAARLLVVVSDGQYRDQPRIDGQKRLDRLRATGCAVLWLTLGDRDTPLAGATVHRLIHHNLQTIAHPSGTVILYCSCMWLKECATPADADTEAAHHLATAPPATDIATAIGRAATAALRAAR